jgi:hypothetical protein
MVQSGAGVKRSEKSRRTPLTVFREIDRDWRDRGRTFFLGWDVRRLYDEHELAAAAYLRLIIVPTFEPVGEECGTLYSKEGACGLCGFGRRQISNLKLDVRRIPRGKDLAETIAGDEWVFSRRLCELIEQNHLTGAEFRPIEQCASSTVVNDWRQIIVSSAPIGVSRDTIVGIHPFDHDTAGTYRCPNGHLLGLNLLSELSLTAAEVDGSDFLVTREAIGAQRGVLVPRRLIVISQDVWRILRDNEVRGWRVEVAHLV